MDRHPTSEIQPHPQWPHTENFKQLDAKFKALQKENYDQHHCV